jgi:hypothetical protein
LSSSINDMICFYRLSPLGSLRQNGLARHFRTCDTK